MTTRQPVASATDDQQNMAQLLAIRGNNQQPPPYRYRYWRLLLRRQLPCPIYLSRPAVTRLPTGCLAVVPRAWPESGNAGTRRFRPYQPASYGTPPAGSMPREACSSGSGHRFLGIPPAPLQAPIGTGVLSLTFSLRVARPEVPDFTVKVDPTFIAGSGLVHPAPPAGRPRRRIQAPQGSTHSAYRCAGRQAGRGQQSAEPNGVHVLRQTALDHINTSRGVHG